MTAVSNSITELARAARLASVSMQSVTNEQKNEALLRIKQVLSERRNEIFEANEQDKKVQSNSSPILVISMTLSGLPTPSAG